MAVKRFLNHLLTPAGVRSSAPAGVGINNNGTTEVTMTSKINAKKRKF